MDVKETPVIEGPEAFEQALNDACKEWQTRLGLLDWRVEVSTERLAQLMDGEAVASCTYSIERKTAKIKMIDPVDLPLVKDQFLANEATDYDFHLVHELLHLHFVWFAAESDASQVGIAQEQAINAISRSLVQAYRANGQLATPAVIQHGHYI